VLFELSAAFEKDDRFDSSSHESCCTRVPCRRHPAPRRAAPHCSALRRMNVLLRNIAAHPNHTITVLCLFLSVRWSPKIRETRGAPLDPSKSFSGSYLAFCFLCHFRAGAPLLGC